MTTFATTAARRWASALLSPSSTNWSRDAVGMGQLGGRAERILRVRPPPGMNGISDSGVPLETCCETGDEYEGIGSTDKL